ncbi:unnamed protein product [Caenorhabditis auriculariae]|uniref:adenosylmethionine decarboxylase n=1 Tax=Caenorhabditis auriculariae TaxID=2777116 RepID=A0A8S1GM37_9PELO|nr:unnamed protein product [Caenorhabditis auriculariae]
MEEFDIYRIPPESPDWYLIEPTFFCSQTQKTAKEKPKEEVSRGVSAYALFFRERQLAEKQRTPRASFGELSKRIARQWDSLSQQQKMNYKRRCEMSRSLDMTKAVEERARRLETPRSGESLEGKPYRTDLWVLCALKTATANLGSQHSQNPDGASAAFTRRVATSPSSIGRLRRSRQPIQSKVNAIEATRRRPTFSIPLIEDCMGPDTKTRILPSPNVKSFKNQLHAIFLQKPKKMSVGVVSDCTQTLQELENVPIEEYFFEGAEKLLEIWFTSEQGALTKGLRNIPRSEIDRMLEVACCKVLHAKSNELIDSYVLSESSLFVSSHRIIIKTCGATRLLAALPVLINLASKYGQLTQVQSVYYSRKNFLRPMLQPNVHRNFDSEVAYLDSFFEDGHAYCLGSLKQDRWYLYTMQREMPHPVAKRPDHTLEILMSELDDDVLRKFNRDVCIDGPDCFVRSGIDKIIPAGAEVHDELFDPCGYSMNAYMNETDQYATIHVTPEKEFSFASFETNQDLVCLRQQTLKVLKCFRPGKVLMTVFANDVSLKGKDAQQHLWERELPGYRRTNVQFLRLETETLVYANFIRKSGCDTSSDEDEGERKESTYRGSTEFWKKQMRELVCLVIIFILSSSALYLIWVLGPLPEGGKRPSFPRDLAGLQQLARNLNSYKNDHYTYTMVLFCSAYIFKQTFAIPGSFFMNLLAGALCGPWLGVLLVTTLTCFGASFCFILSSICARPLVERCLASRLAVLRAKMFGQRHRLWLFLLSARVFPFTPHWLLNVMSPALDVPLATHAFTVSIGMIPYNTLCVRAGGVLSKVKSVSDVLDTWTLAELLFVSVVLLTIARFSKRISQPRGISYLPTEHASVD